MKRMLTVFMVLGAVLMLSVAGYTQEGGNGHGNGGRGGVNPLLEGPANMPFYEGGDFLMGVRAGGGRHFYLAIPSVEVISGTFGFGEFMPGAWGFAARGLVGMFDTGYETIVAFGAAGYITAHFGIRNTPVPPLNRLEIYLGFGAKWDTLGDYINGGFSITGYSGFKYMIKENTGVLIDYDYWGGNNNGMIGIEFTL